MTDSEISAAAEFFSECVKYFGTQMIFAEKSGLSQPTINGIVNRKHPAGQKATLAASKCTGVSVHEILSGVGTARIRARTAGGFNDLNRTRAIVALSELYGMDRAEVSSVFEELGASIPAHVSQFVWFDVGRAAIDRKLVGIPVLRRIE